MRMVTNGYASHPQDLVPEEELLREEPWMSVARRRTDGVIRSPYVAGDVAFERSDRCFSLRRHRETAYSTPAKAFCECVLSRLRFSSCTICRISCCMMMENMVFSISCPKSSRLLRFNA